MKAIARGLAATALLLTLAACADLGGALGSAHVEASGARDTQVGAAFAESRASFTEPSASFAEARAPLTTAFAHSYAVGHVATEPAAVLPSVEMPDLSHHDDVIRGPVSWYGPRFAGRLTANGETFDPKKLTMAHRELPFGTRVRVTNPANGQSVVVRVNDRGPFVGDRVADLSHAAAKKIGMVKSGVIAAELEILEDEGTSDTETPASRARGPAVPGAAPGAVAPNAPSAP